jgi:hypothetical protein
MVQLFQIIIFVTALFTLLTGIKAFTASGIDLGIGGKKLVGRSGKIAGICLLALSAAMLVFALVGLPLIVGR